MGASPNVSQSALIQRQQLLQKQQLYNQHHLNQRRSPAHHSNALSSFPFNATASQDPLTASLTQNIGNLPPHLQHHLQAQLQSRQLQAQQRLQMHKSKANSSHSQASQATHSNSTSRRPSPSNKRPPRQSPKGTTIGVSDMNGVASSTSGARANPNHALSQSFEDTQSIGSMRPTDLRNSDSARNASQFLSAGAVNPLAQTQKPAVVPEVPIKFEIDTKKIDKERIRVFRERELKGRGNQKKQRLQHRPLNDYVRVHNPDYTTPFHGLVDAFERIVPFHVLLPPEDSSVSSEEWRKCTDDLSEKYNGYYKKLRGHCERLHDSNFEAVGEETVFGQSSLTTEDSLLMERILLDDYKETVRRETALARKRAAEAEAKKLQELNRQRELLQSQARQLSVSGALSPAQAAQIPHLTQASSLHPGPQPSFESVSGSIGVSNGSVSASHVIVSAGAQAALWRQASPSSSQMLSAVQNNGMLQTNSSALVGVDTAQMQRFATSSGDVAGFVNQGQVASSGSEVFLANRPTEQLGSEQYLLPQPRLEKPSDAAHGVSTVPKTGMVDGMMAGQIHMGGDSLVNVDMHDAMQVATAGSAGSQVSAGVERDGGNQVSLTRSGSNSALEENSAVQNGASGPEVGSVAEDDGLLSSFNDDNNVSLNGHGSEAAGKRNAVSSEGTPQSFGIQDGVNAVAVSVGNEGSMDESLEGGDLVGENLGVNHIVSSVDKSSAGESEVKPTDSSGVKKSGGKQEVGALAMGSLLNSDER
ncbi:membrane protein [Gracilaria domingensis]|nr:membrane protein [Gracilaria domingensis]